LADFHFSDNRVYQELSHRVSEYAPREACAAKAQ
jgi:hypothetical protein